MCVHVCECVCVGVCVHVCMLLIRVQIQSFQMAKMQRREAARATRQRLREVRRARVADLVH